MEPLLSVTELGMTAVFLTATATTAVLLLGVFTFTCKFQGDAAPMLVLAALAEVRRLMAAAAGAADASKGSRMRPSRPTSPNLTVVTRQFLFITPVEGSKGGTRAQRFWKA